MMVAELIILVILIVLNVTGGYIIYLGFQDKEYNPYIIVLGFAVLLPALINMFIFLQSEFDISEMFLNWLFTEF
nr:MAG: hypothetical protein [uncultured archaeon]